MVQPRRQTGDDESRRRDTRDEIEMSLRVALAPRSNPLEAIKSLRLETGDWMNNKLIDLSHTVEHGMITYKGLPAPIICDFLSREDSRKHYSAGTEFNIGKIEMVANTGTYVDSPFHRFVDGNDLSELPLEPLANLEGVVIRARNLGRAINSKTLSGSDVKGKAVLIHTDWSRHWRTDQYFEGHTFLTKDAAEFLVDKGAAFVGIDTYNIDDTTDGAPSPHNTAWQPSSHLRAHARLGITS